VEGVAHRRYAERVTLAGGLKLALSGVGRDDRHVRCVRLTVAALGTDNETTLVTDSQGRLRYHLPAGEYLLRLAHGGVTHFAVRDGRWTPVRLQLP
jgi:hypothetical protein